MKKLFILFTLLFTAFLLSSCEIDVSGSDDDDGGNNNYGPVMVNLMYPYDNETNVSLTPTLTWNVMSQYSLRFDIFLDTVPYLAVPFETGYTTSSNEYNITSPLAKNKTYYWKIKARFTDNSNVAGESNVWSFKTLDSGTTAPGLVAYYPFTGNANDMSGKGNHGYVNGAILTYDRNNDPNSAYRFDGAGSFIVVSHNSNLQPQMGLTLAAWIKFNSNGTSVMIEKGSENDPGCYSIKYISGSINFGITLPGGYHYLASMNIVPDPGTWYHVAGTYDNYNLKFYLNGNINSQVNCNLLLGSNYGDLYFGKSSENINYFNGALDEIRIYERALNDSEIQQLYQ